MNQTEKVSRVSDKDLRFYKYLQINSQIFPKLCETINGKLVKCNNLSTEWAIIMKNAIQNKKCLFFHWAAENLMLNMETARISKVI